MSNIAIFQSGLEKFKRGKKYGFLKDININKLKKIEERAKYFENLGVQAFDALHLACAEGNADVFFNSR